MLLRPYEPRDADSVLHLNQTNLEGVAPLDPGRLAWIVDLSDHTIVAEHEEDIAGFTITMAPDTAYDSPNYAWFGENRPHGFCYLDRVVVSPDYRRRGVATALYDAVEDAGARYGSMALEVYVEPPNTGSLSFHGARGYTEIGRTPQEGGKIAAMMLKDLSRRGD